MEIVIGFLMVLLFCVAFADGIKSSGLLSYRHATRALLDAFLALLLIILIVFLLYVSITS